jgi:tRNA G10  N-methylase Trm11
MASAPGLAATVETCPDPLTSPHRSPICAACIHGSELVSFFAATVPGLGPLLRDETGADPGLKAEGEPGFDGRADIVFFSAQRGARFRLDSLRLAEDVFAVISGSGSGSASRVADTLVSRDGLERALSVWASYAGHLSPSMTFRVIARVMDESRFRRTELRSAVERAVSASRPRWRIADPADLEVWVVEHHRARFTSGLRLSSKRMRQHGARRAAERQGALRPVVAAAMVGLAGPGPGRLLDPCCGSGTIAAEAIAAGWQAWASDIDADAVRSAAANVPQAVIRRADARDLPYRDGEFDAVVTNVPFGRQFRVDEPGPWMRSVLGEAARVTRPGGRVVVLAPPPVPRQAGGLVLASSYPLRVLGVSARIWAFGHR